MLDADGEQHETCVVFVVRTCVLGASSQVTLRESSGSVPPVRQCLASVRNDAPNSALGAMLGVLQNRLYRELKGLEHSVNLFSTEEVPVSG